MLCTDDYLGVCKYSLGQEPWGPMNRVPLPENQMRLEVPGVPINITCTCASNSASTIYDIHIHTITHRVSSTSDL